MKTIKIIDLLNMMANKEYDKIPKKIEYRKHEFNYDMHGYWNGALTFSTYINLSNLNDEVEIIEDAPKKIEKLNYEELLGNNLSEEVCKKLNEIIDYINEGNNE